MNTKGNFAKFSPISVISTPIIRRITVAGMTLTTLLASNGMAFAVMSGAAAPYDKANAFGQPIEVFAQNTPDAEITVTDSLDTVAKRKPAEFEATVKALTPYVVEGDDGSVTINAPAEVIKTVDQDSYAAIRDSINKSNQTLQGDTLQSDNAESQRRIPLPRIPWKKIRNAVKKSGKWGYNEPRQSGQPSSALTVRHLPLDGMYKGCPLCLRFFSGLVQSSSMHGGSHR